MRNRRNHYRILHIQRDAPAAVIKSCYRALMHTLDMHPDRGGDHWNATVLNEAYAVLSSPERRAAYDRTLPQLTRGYGSVAVAPRSSPGETVIDEADFCAFCGFSHRRRSSDCARCDSPLTMSTDWSSRESGRRAGRRVAVDRQVRLYTEWPLTAPLPATIRDVSPGGLSLESQKTIERHHIVKINSDEIHAIARIVRCRPAAAPSGGVSLGVEFFTLKLRRTTGIFLSTSG